MTDQLELGAKVKYHTGDSKWKNGTVHAVRRVDDVEGNPRILTYLIDTGRDEHTSTIEHSPKSHALNKEYHKHLRRGVSHPEAIEKASKAVEKMPDEVITEVIRQPEQVDVPAEFVKAVSK